MPLCGAARATPKPIFFLISFKVEEQYFISFLTLTEPILCIGTLCDLSRNFESPKYLGNLYVTEKQEIIVSDYTTPANFFLSDCSFQLCSHHWCSVLGSDYFCFEFSKLACGGVH